MTPFRIRAPFLLLPKQYDTVLSLWRSWFKCMIFWTLYERKIMNLAVISYFMWQKVWDKEEVFMPDLLPLSVVLNCSERSMRSPIFNPLAVTSLGNRFVKWYGIPSLFVINPYNAKKHVHLSVLPLRTCAVLKINK